MWNLRHPAWLGLMLLVTPIRGAEQLKNYDLGQEAGAAMRFFLRRDLGSMESLREIRPPRLSPAARASILRNLPAEGELKPMAGEQRTLARIEAVLRLHDRAGAIEVKLIDIFQAAIALHARSVILISRRALNLLTAEEVQALAAHEIGHDYFWDEYQQAVAHEEWSATRELELRCDGIALISLRSLKIDPCSLGAALRKIGSFNARFGIPFNRDRYVSMDERLRFQDAFIEFAKAGPGAHRGQ